MVNLPFPWVSRLSGQRVTSSAKVVFTRVHHQWSANHVPHLQRGDNVLESSHLGTSGKMRFCHVWYLNVASGNKRLQVPTVWLTFSRVSSSLNEALPSGPAVIFPRSPTCCRNTPHGQHEWEDHGVSQEEVPQSDSRLLTETLHNCPCGKTSEGNHIPHLAFCPGFVSSMEWLCQNVRERFFLNLLQGFLLLLKDVATICFCSTELKDFLNGKGFVLTLSESPGPPCCLPNGL